jgi:hypothetical protein
MLDASWTKRMKPSLAIGAYVNVGLRNFKNACVRVLLKPSSDDLIQRRYLYILGLVSLFLTNTVSGTEVVIKRVNNTLLIATDSKGSEGTPTAQGVEGGYTFGTCKILRIGPNQYFSFDGRRGGDFYNIRDEARSAALAGGTIAEISARFLNSITPKVEAYRRHLNLIADADFTSVAFYGFENGRAICIKSTFYKTLSANEIGVSQKVCPPACDPFISLGGNGLLEAWAARNPGVYDQTSVREVECLVRGAITIADGKVGGSISVARIDASGINFISGKQGACQTGPYEQRTKLEPDPPPCGLVARVKKK